MLLFLDFDGVLHPDEVYLTKNGPQLMGAGQLFMWAPILAEALVPHSEVKIVLSTSWVRNLGFDRARKRLPAGLRDRIIGSTWHSSMAKAWSDQNWWDGASRHDQILRYVARSNVSSWLALDDDADQWREQHRWNLIQTDRSTGVSSNQVITELNAKIEKLKNCSTDQTN